MYRIELILAHFSQIRLVLGLYHLPKSLEIQFLLPNVPLRIFKASAGRNPVRHTRKKEKLIKLFSLISVNSQHEKWTFFNGYLIGGTKPPPLLTFIIIFPLSFILHSSQPKRELCMDRGKLLAGTWTQSSLPERKRLKVGVLFSTFQ